MGVPKFYRWMSERYPCLSEIVKENQIPEFDNLYLDMNGIIHTCSHPNDNDVHFRISEEKMFQDIFHYIEVLFRIIKPREVFFMAVDGCAPRAKMNQQRGRRFRSAKEAEAREKEAVAKGETLPSEKRFDSNCITPGTEFMVRLQEQLMYFVNNKVTNDRLWHGVRIYLSGHETPGEGEHKIMDFIRSEKSEPEYNPNTRHCLYGLDADLIMLGLVSHEPHMSLLREEVRFGKQSQQQRPTTPEETTFHLLHLSLFREYLDEEFSDLRKHSWYDTERIIDDWVLMGYLVGNDFIPNLPNFHINHEALPLLYRTYMQVRPSLDGYLNEGGELNLKRFEAFLIKLSAVDYDQFGEHMEEFDFLHSKQSKEAWKSQRVQKKKEDKASRRKEQSSDINLMLMAAANMSSKDAEDNELTDGSESEDSLTEELKKCGLKVMEFSDESEEEGDTADLEFKMHKREYYREKLERDNIPEDELRFLAVEYVRAVQWILHYYYNGIQSWSWFYPFHYAPYVSDIRGFSHIKLKYEMAKPFLPFQQLLAVLPAASKELLPKAYQGLMTNKDSPIIDYYPLEFEEDLNGKQQPWEAVVKIPFIDEGKLLDAMHRQDSYLSDSERNRNRHGPHHLYLYDNTLDFTYPSSLPGHFPDITSCKSKCIPVPLDTFNLPVSKLNKGLCPGVKLGVYYPGFPTLHHLNFKSELCKDEVKVFQHNSRGQNMILTIDENRLVMQAVEVASTLLGKGIYAEWPHLKEVRVIAVADYYQRFDLVDTKSTHNGSNTEQFSIRRADLNNKEKDKWHADSSNISCTYHKRKGVKIGQTNVLVYACPLLGRKYTCGNKGLITMEKQWAPTPVPFAYQMTVKDIAVHDASFKQFKTLDEVFPTDSECFMLGTPSYGALGKVLGTKDERVTVQFSIPSEPDFTSIIKNQSRLGVQYFPSGILAKKMCMTSHLVSRITGCVFLLRGPKPSVSNVDSKGGEKIHIGLNLKFNKSAEEVPGYTKKSEDGHWLYSNQLLDTLRVYIEQFPEVFGAMSKFSNSDVYYEQQLFGDNPSRLKELQDWLATLDCGKVMKMKSGQKMVEEPIVRCIEEEVRKVNARTGRKKMKLAVRPHLLYRPFDFQGNLVPDPEAEYELFDRVINVREGYTVPFGLKGVVIGIQKGATLLDMLYDVVFDEEFPGGLKLRCSGTRGYRMPPTGLINISYGLRKEKGFTKSDKPLAVVKPQFSEEQADFFPFSHPALYPTSSAHHTQEHQWYADQIGKIGHTNERGQYSSGRNMGRNERGRQTGRREDVRGESNSSQGVPSFASMVNSSQSNARSTGRNQRAEDIGGASSGSLKLTVLKMNSSQDGKPTRLLRKKERTDSKTDLLAENDDALADLSSQNQSSSSSSRNQNVSRTASSNDPRRTQASRGGNEVDDFANLWKTLQHSRDSSPALNNRAPPSVVNIGNNSSNDESPIPISVENVTPADSDFSVEDDWDQYSSNSMQKMAQEKVKGQGREGKNELNQEMVKPEEGKGDDFEDEEERITPNSKAKRDTEKLCEILNLSHILESFKKSPQPQDADDSDDRNPAQINGTPLYGRQISLQEIMESAKSPNSSSRTSQTNPPSLLQNTMGNQSSGGVVPPHPSLYGMPAKLPNQSFPFPVPQGQQMRGPNQYGPQPSAFHPVQPFAKNQPPYGPNQMRFMTPGQFYQPPPRGPLPFPVHPPNQHQHLQPHSVQQQRPQSMPHPIAEHPSQRGPYGMQQGGRNMPSFPQGSPGQQMASPPHGYHISQSMAHNPKLPMNPIGTASADPSADRLQETMLDKLRAFCASQGRRPPKYEYINTDQDNEFFVVIYLPTGSIVEGQPCFGKRNAVECAAFKALQVMREEPPPSMTPTKTIPSSLQAGASPQFIPLQVTKKLTPRKPSTSDDASETTSIPVAQPAVVTAPSMDQKEVTSIPTSSKQPETTEIRNEAKEEKPKSAGKSRGKRQLSRGGPKAKLAINFGGGED